VKASLPQLRGAFALAFLFRGHGDLMIGAARVRRFAIRPWRRRDVSGSDAIRWRPLPTHQLSRGRDWVVLTRESA